MAVYLIGRLPAFRVETIQITGQNNPALTKALNTLKGRSLFSDTLSSDVQRIQVSLPTVGSLNCRRGIPGTLKCQSTLRQEAIIWKTATGSYVVDQAGVVYGSAPATVTGLVVEDKSGAPAKLGQTVASMTTITSFTQLASLLTANHLTVSELFISDTLYQAGAVLTGSTDPSVPFAKASPISALFTFDQPLTGQVATLVETLKEKGGQITNHVDVRVPGYAYIQ